MRYAALDSLRYHLAVGYCFLTVAITHTLTHRAQRTHSAIEFISPPLVEDGLAGTFLGTGEQRSDHHRRSACRQGFCDIAREANSAIGNDRYVALHSHAGAIENRGNLRDADSRHHPGRTNR